jgi:hypothetical protein
MSSQTFRTPAPWAIGPGPDRLYSLGGALAAVRMWLELTPDRPATRKERDLMLALRDLLVRIPAEVGEAHLVSAKRAIKGMVKYARSRAAQDDRITSYLISRPAA